MARQKNPGRLPPDTVKRDEHGEPAGFHDVHVWLRCGWSSEKSGNKPWPARGGNPPTRWTLEEHAGDIMEFMIV